MMTFDDMRNAVEIDPFATALEECWSCGAFGKTEDRALSRTHEARWSECTTCEGHGFLVVFDDGVGTLTDLLQSV